MVISKWYLASFLVVLSTAVMHAADESSPLVVTRELSKDVPVFHMTGNSKNSDVFTQVILVPPPDCYLAAKLNNEEEAFNGLFYAVVRMYADSMLKGEGLPCFTPEDIQGRGFTSSLGTILQSDPMVDDGATLYGKVVALLLKRKANRNTSSVINYAATRGLRVTLDGVQALSKACDEDERRMRKGILLVTSGCERQVDEAIATTLESHCNSPKGVEKGIADLLEGFGDVPVHGGYALVDIEKIQGGLKEVPSSFEKEVNEDGRKSHKSHEEAFEEVLLRGELCTLF